MTTEHGFIRTIYLYLFALVGLFIFVFSSVSLVGAFLNRFVFPQEFVSYDVRPAGDISVPEKNMPAPLPIEEQKANFEKQQKNDFKRQVNSSIPGVIVGYFLWLFHWKQIREDRSK